MCQCAGATGPTWSPGQVRGVSSFLSLSGSWSWTQVRSKAAAPFTDRTIQLLRALSILKPKKNFSLHVRLTSHATGDLSSAWREEQKRKIILGRDLKSPSTCNYIYCQARRSDRGRKDGSKESSKACSLFIYNCLSFNHAPSPAVFVTRKTNSVEPAGWLVWMLITEQSRFTLTVFLKRNYQEWKRSYLNVCSAIARVKL